MLIHNRIGVRTFKAPILAPFSLCSLLRCACIEPLSHSCHERFQDDSDAAYSTLCALRDGVQKNGGANADGSGGQRSIIVACAGYAYHCSQKIYNMVNVRARLPVNSPVFAHSAQGLHCATSASEYILFLDDDVAIYPHTIQTLLHMLSTDPGLFMVTGWPYDVLPSRGLPLACLCRIVYRLSLIHI